jgi:hypothetical protein
MATKDFVSVAADDWYQRRRDDAEGKFFRSVADQGPRKGRGGSTRQGIYIFTADGKLLAYKNAGQAPDAMRDVLKRGLSEFRKLPAERRKPGAIKVDDAGKADRRYSRTPPAGGLVLKAYTRILGRDGDKYSRGTCKSEWGDKAARDHVWLTEKEWKSLIPAVLKKGSKADVPAAVALRIARFHLIDNTRGEPYMWRREDVRKYELTLTVEEASASEVVLRLDGSFLIASRPDAAKAERGYDVRLLGKVRYDRAKKAITAFDVVAVGDHWGEGTYTRGARPGRTPLGVTFELVSSDADGLVPPQAAREIGAYLGTGR